MSNDWVIGRGLLGRAVEAGLGGGVFTRPIHWSNPDRSRLDLADARREFFAGAEGPVRIYWCAGSGVTSTTAEVLEIESSVFDDYMMSFARLSAEDRARTTIFLASSVGGAYAGNPHPPYTEDSPTAPLSAYGETKLAMESSLRRGVEAAGMRAFIGRITNLYGPGQKLGKRQGLISVICETYFTRQPASVYVSLDTLRDYIYQDDCASMVIAGTERARGLPAGAVQLKIIGAGNAVSIGELIGTISRLRRQRPLVAFGGGNARGQAPDLRVVSKVWPDLQGHVMTPLAAGMDATFRAISAGNAQGDLGRS